MKLLVCGGRDFSDDALMFDILDQIHRKEPVTVLIEGGANGADRMARSWAEANKICVMEFPANWSFDGPGAGPIRNNRMLKYGQPDMVAAFPTANSKGTWHMVKRAEASGVRLVVFEK